MGAINTINSVITVITDIRFVGDIAINVVLVTNGTTFTYGPDRSRYQKVQTRSSDNTTITTQYFGKVYEKIKQNTNTEHKHFIYLDKQLIAIHIKTDTTFIT
jgi:hypothetical protein